MTKSLKVKKAIKAAYERSGEMWSKLATVDIRKGIWANWIWAYWFKRAANKRMVALDIGCGGGRSTVTVAPFVKKVVGIDFSRNSIKYAKKNRKGKNIEYLVCDAETEPIPGGPSAYDLMVSMCAIHPDCLRAEIAIPKMFQSLRPGGRIILQLQESDWLKELKWSNGYTKPEIRRILARAGFGKIEIVKRESKLKAPDKEKLVGFLRDIGALARIKHYGRQARFERLLESCEKKGEWEFTESTLFVMAERPK
jgi:SAM-dependent methyltransferase